MPLQREIKKYCFLIHLDRKSDIKIYISNNVALKSTCLKKSYVKSTEESIFFYFLWLNLSDHDHEKFS